MKFLIKILNTPSAFSVLLVGIIGGILTLTGIVVQSRSQETIARLPIEATATAEARKTLDASLLSTQQALATYQSRSITQLAFPTFTPLKPIQINETATPDKTRAAIEATATKLADQLIALANTQTALAPISSLPPTYTQTPTITPAYEVITFKLLVYTVDPGNTFEYISKFYTGTQNSVKAIKKVSGLDILQIGSKLYLPVYTIKSGDTLSKISAAFRVSQADLMDGNGITDSNYLIAGRNLIIPIDCRIRDCSPFTTP